MIGVVVASAALFFAALGTRWFQFFVMGVCFFLARELASMLNAAGAGIPVLISAVSAILFPALVPAIKEEAVLVSVALIFIGMSIVFVLRGMRPGVLISLAGTLFVAAYAGLLTLYVVLIRHSPSGFQMMATLIMVVLGYRAAAWLSTRVLATRMTEVSPIWSVLGGSAGSIIAGLLSLLLFREITNVITILGLAALVAIAGLVGDYVLSVIKSSANIGRLQATLPGNGGLITIANSILLAAPAFYFGIKLYLT